MENSESLEARLRGIRAIALDVDGVLTDGGVWWGANGDEWKRFCFADIMGVALARRAGLKLALISGEDSPLVDRFATKLKIAFVAKGCRDKAAALREFAASVAIDLASICFIGDDINDLGAMSIAGLAAAPGNAIQIVRTHANLLLKQHGGSGAVRELTDEILTAQGFDIREVYLRP